MTIWKATDRPRVMAEQTMPEIAAHMPPVPPIAAEMPISGITINTSIIAAPMMTRKLQTTVTWFLSKVVV